MDSQVVDLSSVSFSTFRWLSEEYYGLNGDHYDVLESPPSPLEFSRILHISRPVLIKGYTIPSLRHWSNKYLSDIMGDRPLSVAVTPNGYADAVTRNPDGKWYFVEPYYQKMTMKSLLSRLGLPSDMSQHTEVFYLQSQDGNLFSSSYFTSGDKESHSELASLRGDVPAEIPWCSEALGRCPDAVNLWIGDRRSVTSIHSDPYENIYHVARGSKTFLLLPPTEGWCLKERLYPHATYQRESENSPLFLKPSLSTTPPVRWPSILHPEQPGSLPDTAHPIIIDVKAGETLYLPAGWWHHVRQSGLSIALNWWYDIEPRGSTWVWLRLLRGVPAEAAGGEEVDE
ncbi:Clavaminate synthase-like protein [Multifurca ochricompacta]|uniref:Clavaminate synthase-like protein n=1 Tax=Multifurca ochricompacta TaxID=376703 RepID=A0AAD4MBY1_9AGAM|nr:Clavaminate synthase-like protein [Multifurca ochricompacta]